MSLIDQKKSETKVHDLMHEARAMEAMETLQEANSSGAETRALRYNEGKPEYSLIDLNCLEPMARVLAFGAQKYDRNNWMKGFNFTKVLDSTFRHMAALQRGEWIDPESGLPHVGHIQCNAMFMGLDNNIIDIDELRKNKEEWKPPYTT